MLQMVTAVSQNYPCFGRLLSGVENKPYEGFEALTGFRRSATGQWYPQGTKDLTTNHSHCSSTATLPPASTLPQVPLLATCFAQ